jgi:hypothetical protein
VSNYLYANPVHYGTDRDDPKIKSFYPGSSTQVLRSIMTRPPMNMDSTQIVELNDGTHPRLDGKPAPPPAIAPFKVNIEAAITDFVAGCRAQDRIMILFAGHAVDIEKDCYLVPLEAELGDAKKLIPIKWVFDQLAKCKAQEKVLILDVCRFPPARGFELPGGGEPGTGKMTEQLDALLKDPPAGVQVWTSCIKDQTSIELERGSVFMQALCGALQERPAPLSEPKFALPLRMLEEKVNKRMKDLLGPQKFEQTSRLSGMPAMEGGYNADEPLPPKLVLRNSLPGGGSAADRDLVKSIKDEIDLIPPARKTRQPPDFLPPFSAKVIEVYQKDYQTLDILKKMIKDEPEKYPVRAAVLDAIDALRANDKITIVERLTGGAGPIDKKIKEKFLKDQQAPGMSIFELERVLKKLEEAKGKLDQEPAKRWQAHYHYALARFQSRVVYLYEYNFILAQVRSDSLPEINPAVHNGWRIGSRAKVQISEAKVKDMVKNINKTWKAVAEQNPETPWAALAKRERMLALGLEWKAWPR